MIALDIIVPVYNEGKLISPLLESLAKHVRTCIRVFVCYDRNDDTTLPFLKKRYRFPVIPVKNTGTSHAGG
jgi:glycosyltransferase involved in cell wall biosynthesis